MKNNDSSGNLRTLAVTAPDGKKTVVAVEGNPFVQYKDKLPALLIKQRGQIAEMERNHGPANVLWIVSDIIRGEAEHPDTQEFYKIAYSELHANLEKLIDQFVTRKLVLMADAVRSGEANMEKALVG